MAMSVMAGRAQAQPTRGDEPRAGEPTDTAPPTGPAAQAPPTSTTAPAPPGGVPIGPPLAPPGATLPLAAPAAGAAVLPGAPEHRPNLIAQVTAGGLLGAAGLFLGGVAGFEIACHTGCDGDFPGLGGALFGAAIGTTLATATGVVLAGSDDDHDASFGVTWLGATVGGVAGVLIAGRTDSETVAAIALLGCTSLGGVVAFDLSRTRHRPAGKPKPELHLVPTAAGGGFSVSLVGRGF
jgi:hypothetical protein